jgi:hypothetical protein
MAFARPEKNAKCVMISEISLGATPFSSARLKWHGICAV